MSSWFVVQSHPQREAFVANLLRPFTPYLPVFKNARARVSVLFPGYLFVPEVRQWSPIKNCVGVRTLLMTGEHPAKIPDRVIQSWRGKERNGLVQLPPAPRFRKDQRLTITKGTLRNHPAIYVGMNGRDRERVLIELLGQWVPISIATSDLIDETPSRFRRRVA